MNPGWSRCLTRRIFDFKQILQGGMQDLFNQASFQLAEALLLLRCQIAGVQLSEQLFALGIQRTKDFWSCYNADTLSVRSTIEAEGFLPVVFVNEVSLAECTARKYLNGIDCAHVSFYNRNDLLILSMWPDFTQGDFCHTDTQCESGAHMSMEIYHLQDELFGNKVVHIVLLLGVVAITTMEKGLGFCSRTLQFRLRSMSFTVGNLKRCSHPSDGLVLSPFDGETPAKIVFVQGYSKTSPKLHGAALCLLLRG